MILEELTAFSNLYGSDEELVLAGGGNTSAKDGNIMYIKASGTQLATITPDGFVAMDRNKLAGILTKEYPSGDDAREAMVLADLNDARMPGQGEKRPSVETVLHSLFEQKYVLHLHPALINGLTCSQQGKETAKKLIANPFIWIDACKPGYILSKICFDEMNRFKAETGKACDMLLLENHGIFVASDTVDGLGEKLNSVLASLNGAVKRLPDFETGVFDGEKAEKCFGVIREIYGDDCVISFEPSIEALRFAETPESAQPIMRPFTPDHIVYCKQHQAYGHCNGCIAGAVERCFEKNGYMPKIILISGCGFFAVDSSAKGSQTAAMLFNDAIKIAVYAESFGGAKPMSDELSDFIANWEVESYRQKQNKGEA